MRVRRGNVRDAVFEGGRAAVYVDDQVIVLSEIATVILDAVPELGIATLNSLTAAVVAEFGPPPPPGSATDLTRDQVMELVAHGVLADEDPTLPSTPTARSTKAVRDALRHIRATDQLRWQLPPDVAPAELLASAHQHHVLPFLAHHASRLDLPTGLESALAVAATRADASVDVLVDELGRALDALDRAGVRAIVFKGVALATQAYGDPSARGAGDLDLLVPPADLATAHTALSGAGWRPDPAYPEPGPSWAWRHQVRTGYELTLTSTVSAIDLHWHLLPTRGTSPAFDQLWVRRQVLDIGGHRVPTLSRYDALAHSAAHSAKDQWRWLRSLLDVHVLASDTQTWTPDRPLRDDELITLGLAVRAFGLPDCSPVVVSQAVSAAEPHWAEVVALHTNTERVHDSPATPGTSLMRSIRGAWRTGAAVPELPRVISRSLLPPWLTVEEPSPHAVVAVPRVLSRRTRGMARRVLAPGKGTPDA